MQSMENYNGCCIGSDIRCLTNVHENSIIQTELYSPPLCPAVGKKQGTCAKFPDVYWSCTIRGTKDCDFVHFCSFSFFQISNSVLWIFCTLFGFDDNTSTFMYRFSPYMSYLSQFSFKQKEKRVIADSHLIMLSNIVMRQMSPRRDCTAERFLRVLLEISGRNKSRNWGSGDSHDDTYIWWWAIRWEVWFWLHILCFQQLWSGWKICFKRSTFQ